MASELDFRKLNKEASKNRITTAKELTTFKTSVQKLESLKSLQLNPFRSSRIFKNQNDLPATRQQLTELQIDEYGGDKGKEINPRPKSQAEKSATATHRRVVSNITYGTHSKPSTPIKSVIVNYFAAVAELEGKRRQEEYRAELKEKKLPSLSNRHTRASSSA